MEQSHFELAAPMVMVLLKKNLLLGSVATERKLEQAVAELQGATLMRTGAQVNDAVMIQWAGYIFSALVVNKPIPETEFHACLHSAPEKKHLQKIVKSHKAHLIVTTLGKPDHPGQAIDQSVALMMITHMLAQLGESNGYYWSNSERLLDAGGFEEAFQGAMKAHIAQLQGEAQNTDLLPLAYWVDIRLFSDGGKMAAMTQGLSLFTGYEAEIDFLAWLPEQVYERMAGVIAYIFTHGAILHTGESLGINDEERFNLKFLKHPRTGKPLLQLTLDVPAEEAR